MYYLFTGSSAFSSSTVGNSLQLRQARKSSVRRQNDVRVRLKIGPYRIVICNKARSTCRSRKGVATSFTWLLGKMWIQKLSSIWDDSTLYLQGKRECGRQLQTSKRKIVDW